jgi:hypothetical protein
MKTFVILFAQVLLGFSSWLEEPAMSCGGDILITIEDIHFQTVEVDPAHSVCVVNETATEFQLTDTSGEAECTYQLAPYESVELAAQPAYEQRTLVVDPS